MDHQTHIRLVDAHAKGVGGSDDTQFASDEGLLRVLLGFGGQPGMIGRRRQPLVAQEPGELLGLLAGGAIGNGTAALLGGQRLGNQLGHPGKFFTRGSLDHIEAEIVAPGAAIQHIQFDVQRFAEMADDVCHHFRLGSRRKALDQRQGLVR